MAKKQNLIFYKLTPAWNDSGDCLIHKAIIDLLRQHGRLLFNDFDENDASKRRFINSLNPQKDERLSCYPYKSFVKALFCFGFKHFFARTSQIYFVTGPGQHKLTTNRQAVRNLCAAILVAAMKILKIKTIRIGLSQEISGFLPKWSERILALFLDYYYVRDSISLKALQKCGIRTARIAPDLSFSYEIAKDIVIKKKQKHLKKLALIFNNHIWKPQNQDDFMIEAISRYVEVFVKNNPDFELIIAYQVEEDRQFAEKLSKNLKRQYKQAVFFKDSIIWLEDAPLFYSEMDYVISNRLHALLLAYKFGCLSIPLVDIEMQPKITGIFRDIGLESRLQDFSQEDFFVPHANDLVFWAEAEKKCDIELQTIVKSLFETEKV